MVPFCGHVRCRPVSPYFFLFRFFVLFSAYFLIVRRLIFYGIRSMLIFGGFSQYCVDYCDDMWQFDFDGMCTGFRARQLLLRRVILNVAWNFLSYWSWLTMAHILPWDFRHYLGANFWHWGTDRRAWQVRGTRDSVRRAWINSAPNNHFLSTLLSPHLILVWWL